MQFDELDSRDIVAGFWPRFELAAANGWLRTVAFTVNSDRAVEKFNWVGSAPSPREWKGQRQARALNKYAMTLANVPYETTLEIHRFDRKRDKTAGITRAIDEMADKAAGWPDRLGSDVLLDNPISYDGVALFANNHVSGDSGVQTNLLTSNEVPAANVAVPTAPTPTEMANIISQSIGHMYGLLDDQGDPANGNASSFMVMCGTTGIWNSLQQAVRLVNLSGGATNPLQGVRSAQNQDLRIEPRFNIRLSAQTDQIKIIRTDASGAMVLQIEQEFESGLLAEGSDVEFQRGVHQFGVNSSMAVGPGLWQYASTVTMD